MTHTPFDFLSSNTTMLMLCGIVLGLGPAFLLPFLLLRWRLSPWAVVGLGFLALIVSALVRADYEPHPLNLEQPRAFWVFAADRFCFSLALTCNGLVLRRQQLKRRQ
jgi:hypothetical protein